MRRTVPSFFFSIVICCSVAQMCQCSNYQLISLPYYTFNPGGSDTNDGSSGVLTESDVIVDTETINDRLTFRGKCDKCACGMMADVNTRIVGGVKAGQHEFPWLVALLNKRGKFFCAATIITKYHLLTAAHCTLEISANKIQAVIGEYNRAIKNDRTKRIIGIREIIRHPNFNYYTQENDIAILKVKTEVKFNTQYIQPACLPSFGNRNYNGIKATVIGWGKTSESSRMSDEVRKVQVPITLSDQCRKRSDFGEYRVGDNMMCAGYMNGGKDACTGDSGGPLQIAGSKPGTMEIVGIVSWGTGCGRPKKPGVYTKLDRYMYWVESKVGNECICKA